MIERPEFDFDRDFTRVPNAWARDRRLSRKARGLLTELLSHRPGWRISQATLEGAGLEGRESVRSAINELRDLGYLVCIQTRNAGKFGETDFRMAYPTVASTASGFPVNGQPVSGSTVDGKPATKEDHDQEDHLEEDHPFSSEAAVAPVRPDVERLLDLLDRRIAENGGKVPGRTRKNRDAARLLLDRDGLTEEQVRRAILWATDDEFWRSNILSMSKLREKYEQLRLAAQRKPRDRTQDAMTAIERLREKEDREEIRDRPVAALRPGPGPQAG